MQGCGEHGILHKDEEEGRVRTQLQIQREEEERGKNSGKNLYGSSFIMVVYCGKEWVRQGKQA